MSGCVGKSHPFVTVGNTQNRSTKNTQMRNTDNHKKGRARRKREMGGESLFVDHSPLD